MTDRLLRRCLLTAVFLCAGACGGGGSGPASEPPPPPPAGPEPSYVKLNSDTGDYIGQGLTYSYSKADAEITATADSAHLTILIQGDQHWRGEFVLPDGYSELQQGSYPDLERLTFHDPAVGGMSWTGEGRGCNGSIGWLIIDSVTYDGQTLTGIDLQFEQHCEYFAAALHGEIHWDADDPTRPPGPVLPLPSGLWEPSAGSTPATGDYVYLDSQQGDWVGAGGEYLYVLPGSTLPGSTISVTAVQNHLSVYVGGNEQWNGDFQVMNSLNGVEIGYYPDLRRYPFHNPVKGGLNWSGEGRGCGSLTGWFAVDSVTYDGSTLTAVELRFEQHCQGNAPALRGEIHWSQH